MAVCIFTIQRGCASDTKTYILYSRLIRPLKGLFTDTDMHDIALKEEMEVFYSYLQNILRIDDLIIPSSNFDLVLDIMPDGDRIQWSYYYACHDTRCLSWLEEYDAGPMTSEIDGVESPAHLSASQAPATCSVFTDSMARASSGGLLLVRELCLTGLFFCTLPVTFIWQEPLVSFSGRFQWSSPSPSCL